MGARQIVTTENWPSVCTEYKNGLSLEAIGRNFGCSRTYIKKILLECEIEIRPSIVPTRMVDPTLEEIAERALEERKKRIGVIDD
jgi:AraC-like DNA-binding protein